VRRTTSNLTHRVYEVNRTASTARRQRQTVSMVDIICFWMSQKTPVSKPPFFRGGFAAAENGKWVGARL
jgi:hypothetical protein